MKKNDVITNSETTYRILDIKDDKVLVVDCNKLSVPKWINANALKGYTSSSFNLSNSINEMYPEARKIAYNRFEIVANILPFVADKTHRNAVIAEICNKRNISRQTVCKYFWLYLVYQDVSALAPKENTKEKELTVDEKNIRWALNKFYYTRNKNTLTTAYTLMLKEKYCNAAGQLLEHYPTFNQFRYFYRKHKKLETYYISRNGLTNYQRNNRPLLGDGVQEYASNIGTVAMLDSTVADLYLINDSGSIVGRPYIVFCIDSYSGMLLGYSLTWEGGAYSLRNLMLNVIADKVELCNKHGIKINKEDWNCSGVLPLKIITDMGKEYVGENFNQLTDLGITIESLPPYRPELKGSVEVCFLIIQNLFKPYLKGKGIIEPDFQERGTHDYRKDACLTMDDFEKILLNCIIYYNTKRIIENFPYTDDMIDKEIQPYANCIWNYGYARFGNNLIKTDYTTLALTLLPRTKAKFTRKGLIVNKLRYKNDKYTEMYLKGGDATVAYNSDDVTKVWLIENGFYVEFYIIDNRFESKTAAEVESIRDLENALKIKEVNSNLQAKIDLINHIDSIANNSNSGSANIKNIRVNRKKEQIKTHIDFTKECMKYE